MLIVGFQPFPGSSSAPVAWWQWREHFAFLPYKVLQSCSTALLNEERALLGRRGEPRAPPVPGLPAEKIGARTGTTGFRKCFLSANENVAALWAHQHSESQASVATSTNWHFSVIFLLLFLNLIPSFTASLLLFKINLTFHSVLFPLMLT